MPTHITQTESSDGSLVRMHVSGEMMLEDALVLEKVVNGLQAGTEREVVLDLADLDFLDSESGAVLRRLADQPAVRIEGIEIFLQSVINDVEKR